MREAMDWAPFRLGPESSERGALLLHGFIGSPFEMLLLGESLAVRGIAVDGPLLPGHRGTTRELAATGWRDWLDGAERALERLKGRAPRVAVCGLSMGGLLTLELARRHREVGAIAVMATALRLSKPALALDRALVRVPLLQRAWLPKLAGSDIADPVMKRRNSVAQGRAGMPLSSLHSLMEFGAHVTAHLAEVRAPALVAHSRRDHTVPFACLDAVANGLGSTVVARLVLERSFHCITLDVEREQLFRAVGDHLDRHL